MDKIDFFICHASEDKQDFVKDLAEQLMRSNSLVFYDEYSIKLGDSLTNKINEGIANSKNGVIVLSQSFFDKNWTNAELQAIFNKSIQEDFNLFLVYHKVDNSEIRKKYPLLADIKATDSSKGYEKVAEELMLAAGINPSLKYMKTDLSDGDGMQTKEGFQVSLRVMFPRLGDPRIPKVLYEIGEPNVFHTRARLVIKRNERLYFEFVTRNFHEYGLSIDLTNWKKDESHIVSACFLPSENVFRLYDNDEIVDEIYYTNIDLPEIIFNKGFGIVGCSLELEFPCPFTLSHLAIFKGLEKSQTESFVQASEKLNKALGRS